MTGLAPPPDAVPEGERACRSLRVYAFDPSHGRRDGNHMVLRIPYEPLQPGPIGRRVAVIDEDTEGHQLHPPVDLEAKDVLREGGLEPNECNPAFHQQMVYAVTANLLQLFDRALGREVRFRSRHGEARARLLALPHGTHEQNAYFDPQRLRLVFGFFPAGHVDSGRSIPGQMVYSCLSHNIVMHAATHAVLDGLREDLQRPTNLDSTAFQEGFADAIAYLHHFTFPEAVLCAIERTGGRLYEASLQPEWGNAAPDRNALLMLGEQFAHAAGFGTEIRTALGVRTGSGGLEKITEPHLRGAAMAAALLEAFFRVYSRRTRGLFRLSGRSPSSTEELHPDLARRLAGDAAHLAAQMLQLCIRALAYCPAVDVALGDFVRALLTVHLRLDPEDPGGLRDALIDSFAARGIYPPDVDSMSESELIWKAPREPLFLPRAVARTLRRADADGARDPAAEQQLQQFCDQHRELLGLVPELPIAVSPVSYAIRFAGAELDVGEELVCQILQSTPVRGGQHAFGGTTLIFGDDGRNAPLRYAITKRLDPERRRAQRRWFASQGFA